MRRCMGSWTRLRRWQVTRSHLEALASATIATANEFETWERICKRFGWPQTFTVTGTRGAD